MLLSDRVVTDIEKRPFGRFVISRKKGLSDHAHALLCGGFSCVSPRHVALPVYRIVTQYHRFSAPTRQHADLQNLFFEASFLIESDDVDGDAFVDDPVDGSWRGIVFCRQPFLGLAVDVFFFE